jgi:putative tryptophan/tyrosine transport system substrate-binding protein
MKRREFLLAAAMLAPAIRHAMAQQPTPKKRIAVALASTKVENIRRGPMFRIWDDEMRRVGLIEGENIIIDSYSAEGRSDRYESLAREVVATNPDLIYTGGTPMTLVLKAATTTIPIVTMTGDPIRFGIVSNIARPGGNITGGQCRCWR